MGLAAEQRLSIGGVAPFPVGAPRWRRASDGWDRGTQQWVVPGTAGARAEQLFPQGAAHPDRQWMRVDDLDIEDQDGEEIVTIQYRGLLAAQPSVRPIGRRLTGLAESSSGQNIFTPDWSGGKKAEVDEPRLQYEVKYIQVDTAPDMTVLGTALTPPEAPTPPPFIWAFLSDAIYLFPSGWVLANRTADQIPGAPVWLVSDSYKFQQERKPGDI